jgi:subtilisin family serine protease
MFASALFAPGKEILTLLPGGRYDFASGDSIATAQVTGVVALLLAKSRDLSAAAVYRLLRESSEPSNALGGGELVNACAAVKALLGHGSCSPISDADHRLAEEQDRRLVLQ